MTTRRLPLWLLVGLAGLIALFLVRPAAAHAELAAASPAPGAHLAAPPAQIRLTFNGEIAAGSTFTLFDATFQQIPVVVALDPEQPTQLIAPVPDLAEGTYTVQWLSVNIDGHSLSGSYNFTIGEDVMMDSVVLAAAINPPAWVAWLMVILALGLPLLTRLWLRSRR